MSCTPLIPHVLRRATRHFVHGIILHAVKHPIAVMTAGAIGCTVGIVHLMPPTTAPAYVAPPEAAVPAPVPEPSSMVMLVGVVGALVASRKKAA